MGGHESSVTDLASCRVAGVSWVDMHRLAERVQLEALVTLGLLQVYLLYSCFDSILLSTVIA